MKGYRWPALAGVLALLLGAVLTNAQTGDGYDLFWSTVDGGGYIFSEGGGYQLGGTIGQPDAGEEMSGDGYALSGGFWGGIEVLYRALLPLILKDY